MSGAHRYDDAAVCCRSVLPLALGGECSTADIRLWCAHSAVDEILFAVREFNRLSLNYTLQSAGSMPMYKAAHVYFSSSLAPELLAELRSTPGLAAHLATLREANLEFSIFDRRTFYTNQVRLTVQAAAVRPLQGAERQHWQEFSSKVSSCVLHKTGASSAAFVWGRHSRPHRQLPTRSAHSSPAGGVAAAVPEGGCQFVSNPVQIDHAR